MKHADHAMYEAKLSGRNRYVFYHHTQQSSEWEKRRVQQFRSLIQSGEMFYSYPPQMDLNTNEVVSIIMKPRWHTESALGETETLQKLADLGFHVTVANFAMESGAIGLLRSAPVFAVRLPENVMSHVPEQPRDCQLVSGLVSLLGSMDTRVYLDGVHTERQLRFAQTLDLEGASGYWFGSHATLPEIESQLLLQPV
ncbi:MAG: EAL domain-containing protein [Gammaproteobacteria bacterium]|nr:MAG: EAL domain-containing protein [Gammaproteobacteria bacterium]